MSELSCAQVETSEVLTKDEIETLRRITSPTIANAIEILQVRPKGEGYTNSKIRCFFPELPALVGYACTALIVSRQPPAAKRSVSRTSYWDYTRTATAPKVTVVQDLSDEPGGAYWGEVNANIHLALGSAGVITNGTVRDLEEVRNTSFHFFASGVSVSHGFAHLEDFNQPVKVFGMIVNPGDLIHADRHGAVLIPNEVARETITAAMKIDHVEREMISLCRSEAFSIGQLDKLISPDY